MKQVVLGICHCDTKQHGQFDGQIITLAGQDCLIRETIIVVPPRSTQSEQLIMNRCNFFLDSHAEQTGVQETTLSARIVCQTVTHEAPKVVRHLEHSWEYEPSDMYNWWYKYFRQWTLPRIPLPSTVLRGMSRLFNKVPAEWQTKLLAGM